MADPSLWGPKFEEQPESIKEIIGVELANHVEVKSTNSKTIKGDPPLHCF
jgi:hypothetical protein